MNNNGNPVLPLAFEQLTKELFKLKSGYVLTMGTPEAENKDFRVINFFKYVNHLFQLMAKNVSPFHYPEHQKINIRQGVIRSLATPAAAIRRQPRVLNLLDFRVRHS
jgi:hypothetical protein